MNTLTPFLTKEQKEFLDNKRAESFQKEYLEICKKYKLQHIALLQPTPTALQAKIVLTQYNERTTEGDNKETSVQRTNA